MTMALLADIFSAAFLLHLGAAAAATVAGAAIGVVLGLTGHVALFAPVAVAAGLTGMLTARRLNAANAAFVWMPATVWFVGWAVASFPLGLNHFMRVFVGTGYCGDFSCTGQFLVTSPMVGSVAYFVGVRAGGVIESGSSDRSARGSRR